MSQDVTDKFSNFNDNLAHAAKTLGRSKHRIDFFRAVYRGKKAFKTQEDIRKATKLSQVRMLQVAKDLSANGLIKTRKIDGHLAFGKDAFFAHHGKKVLSLAESKEKLAKLPTKVSTSLASQVVTIKIQPRINSASAVTIDDIATFSKVKRVSHGHAPNPIAENVFKEGIKKIIGEQGKFADWGGEKNDLFTTKVKIKSKRMAAAFAFKGKGKKGILKPKDFGKNGDQIERLFQSDAELFVLQYWGQLDQSVYEQMKTQAVARSVHCGHKVYFCVIDGDDTERLRIAYSKFFA